MNLSIETLAILGVIGLLGIGLFGLITSRNLIKIVVSLQLLVKAAMLGIVLAGWINGQAVLAESLVITIIVADTIVAVIGIAMIVQVRRQIGTLDVSALSKLKG
jgi:NADH:ubiquinone oxidoreductase subunit K